MFDQLSKNYELGLIAYVLCYVVMCLPIIYVMYKVKKNKRRQEESTND